MGAGGRALIGRVLGGGGGMLPVLVARSTSVTTGAGANLGVVAWGGDDRSEDRGGDDGGLCDVASLGLASLGLASLGLASLDEERAGAEDVFPSGRGA